MPNADVVVVGGGPAGLTAAINAASLSDVLVFEEHLSFGQPTHCGGLVSLDIFEKLRIKRREDVVLNKIRGFVFHSPSDTTLEVDAGRPCAQVIDRALFDQNLADIAEEMGCRLVHRRVLSLKRRERAVLVGAGCEQEKRASVVIDAEGLGRRLAARTGFDTRIREAIPAAQMTVRCREIDPFFAHVFLGKQYGEFMAYVIPVDNRTARVGCATSRSDPSKVCEKVCKETYGEYKVIHSSRWAIWTGGELKKTRMGRILLVGDAAGHTKPTTGGGIVLGGMMARIVGCAAGRYAATLDERELNTIGEKSRPLTRRVRRMLLVRRLLSASSDRTLDKGIEVMRTKREKLQRVLRTTDFDLHDKVLLDLAPSVASTRVLPMLIKDILARGTLN